MSAAAKKVVPADEFATVEQAVIGALLNGADIGDLSLEDFHALRPIFQAIRDNGPRIDLVAAKSGMSIAGLDALMSSAPMADFAQRYAQTLRRLQPDKVSIEPASGVQLICAASIAPKPISWLWPGWLAAGKLHILAGAPGTGKSTLAFALAASLSNGSRWPDGTPAEPGQVAIWSGEDDPEDTIVPRLMACGADLASVQIVCGMAGEDPRPFDPALDMAALRLALSGRNIRLLIVDPVVSAVAGDSHKNTEVRRALQPLVDLAAATGCAVLGISHFTKSSAGKDPLDRVTGSLAFGALARVVLAAAKLPEDEHGGARLLARAKSNIGPDTGGVLYTLEQIELPDNPGVANTRVLWGAAVEGTARDLLAKAEHHDGEEKTATDEARDWLADLLSKGPMRASDVQREAKQAGISYKALRRAKDKLGVVTQKQAFSGGWEWCLPQDAPRCPEDSPTQKEGALELFAKNTKAPHHPPYLPQEFQDAPKNCSGAFGAPSQKGHLGSNEKTADDIPVFNF